MKKSFLLLVTAFMFGQVSVAQISGNENAGAVVTISPSEEQRCSNVEYDWAKTRFLNYEKYKDFDDEITTSVWDISPFPSELKVIGGIGTPARDVPPIDMTVSLIHKTIEPNPDLNEISRVQVLFALSPIGLNRDYKSVYPKLPLECTNTEVVDADGKRTLAQKCEKAEGARLYGLTHFNADFEIKEDGCGDNTISIDYTIDLVTNETHIDAIKVALVKQYWAMSVLSDERMDEMFDEEKFFSTYFNDLYSVILSRN